MLTAWSRTNARSIGTGVRGPRLPLDSDNPCTTARGSTSVRRVDGEREAAAHDGAAALVLVAGEVHPGSGRARQARPRRRRAGPTRRRRPRSRRRARTVARRARPGMRSAAPDAREQPLLAPRVAVADDRAHRVDRQRRAQEPRQRGEEAQADAQVVAAQRRAQPRHGSAMRARTLPRRSRPPSPRDPARRDARCPRKRRRQRTSAAVTVMHRVARRSVDAHLDPARLGVAAAALREFRLLQLEAVVADAAPRS